MGGEVPLLLSRHRTSSEIHPAGARELPVFNEFGCPLGVLGPPRYWPKQTREPSSNEMKIRPRAAIIPSKTGEDSSSY